MKQRRTIKVTEKSEIVFPNKTPFLDAICEKRKQRINKDNDETVILAMYERNWILHGKIATLGTAEAGYLRRLAKKYRSWLAERA